MNWTTTVDGAVTTVKLDLEGDELFQGTGLTGEGTAKCRKEDVFSASIGETIALGRAVEALGRQMTERGTAAVVTNDELVRVTNLLVNEAMR